MWQAIYIRKKKQFIVKHVCFAKHRPHEHTNTQIHTHSRAHSHTNQTDIMYIIDIINMCMWLSVIKYNNTEIPCAHTYDSLIIIFYFHFDQYVHYNLKKCWLWSYLFGWSFRHQCLLNAKIIRIKNAHNFYNILFLFKWLLLIFGFGFRVAPIFLLFFLFLFFIISCCNQPTFITCSINNSQLLPSLLC